MIELTREVEIIPWNWDQVKVGVSRRYDDIIAYDEENREFYKIIQEEVCVRLGYPSHKWKIVEKRFPIEMDKEKLRKIIENAPPDNPNKRRLDYYFLQKNLTDYLVTARKRTPQRWKGLFKFVKMIFPNPHPASAFGEWSSSGWWEHMKKKKRWSYKDILLRIRDEAAKQIPSWFREMCEEVGL